MEGDPMNAGIRPGLSRGIQQAQAISLDKAAEIAGEVQELLRAGKANSAWELIRYLHPADMGSIVAGLPRTSRDAMLHVMSPATVAWMLGQMNPVVAGRVGTRLGSRMIGFVLGQIHPNQALATLRRIPILRSQQVAESLDQHQETEELLAHEPDTAWSLMSAQFATVDVGAEVGAARESLRDAGEVRNKLTHVYVTGKGGTLLGQISMVDRELYIKVHPNEQRESNICAARRSG